MLKIISTSDGSDTLYVQELDEHYHSTFGAVRESNHVFIESGYKSTACDPVRIFELGFGTGLNTFLTLLETIKDKRMVYYVSIEKHPLPADIYKKLNYNKLFRGNKGSYYDLIHECRWGIPCKITDNFSLMKIEKDFLEMDTDMVFDIVYFDAFAPEKQPGMWSYNVLERIAALIKPDGVFVTYSAKGQLRRDLKQLGFLVENPEGPPGKRQITQAVKKS